MNSIETVIDKENNLIVHTVKGILRLQDVIERIGKTMRDPSFVQGMDVIWDITGASVAEVTLEDVFSLIRYMVSVILKRGIDFKLAIIADTDLEFGLAKMYTGYGKFLPFSKNVFRTLDEGLAWIRKGQGSMFDYYYNQSGSKYVKVKRETSPGVEREDR